MKAAPNHDPTLGIIVCYSSQRTHPPFAETSFFQQLINTGKRLGIRVIVFSPKEIIWENRTVPSWHINSNGEWIHSIQPLPTLIYDRCYYTDSKHFMNYKPHLQLIIQDHHIRLLGRALSGKLQTYEIMQKKEEIRPFLPVTIRYTSPKDALNFINVHSSALIKPNGGSHGRGVVGIKKQSNGFLVRGRTKSNQPFQYLLKNDEQLQLWIKRFIQDTRYIIQPLLKLTTPDHRPFDIRILVQKNEHSQWETTGMAVRTGKPNMITSNLHGGGQALTFRPFIDRYYSKETVKKILSKIEWVSAFVPPFIEQHHGQLIELGIDVGIDRDGNVWILEVNSKPGRTIFLRTGEKKIRQRAVQLPMFYAHSLLQGT